MKIERTKNATKNIIYGLVLKIYQIIVPFLMRTAMIYLLGVEYLGLNSLFTSILSVLNLVELGVGSAMVFSMYKPIVDDDKVKICALMKLFKIYYRIIGVVILVIGLIICPFIPKLIKSGVPADMNVYVLYILNLLATVFSYWLFGYKNCLLSAHQRIDVTSKVTLYVNTVQYIIQFVLLFIFKNYYLYVITLLLGQIGINIVTALVVTKMYPEYNASGELSESERKQINGRVKDLFTSKIGSVIVNSADSIVISSFLGLTMLAIYQNYYYIITAIIATVAVIFNSCTAGIGNSIIVETNEKNYNDLKKFTFMIAWIAGFCSCALLCLFQPFMKLWVGKNLLLDYPCVICLVLYYFIYEINQLLNLYKDASGIWHKDRFRPLVTAITNLILNVILVNYIGIYGVLLSTVISMLTVGMPWIIHNLFSEIFKNLNPKEYILKLIKYFIATVIVATLTYYVCHFIQGETIISLIFRGIVCFVVSNTLFYVIYRKTKEMNDSKALLNKILKLKNKRLS